jgi:glycosyltransferase involved in cell wall biosynthesis
LILVNDQCTDGTEEIVKKYLEHDARIKWIDNKYEKGIVGALNTAIDNAKGVYCARIDADDMMYPKRVQMQIKAFEQDPFLKLCATH